MLVEIQRKTPSICKTVYTKALKLKLCRTENRSGSPSGSAAIARPCALLISAFPLLPILKGIKKKNASPFVVSANGKSVSVRSYQRSFELLLKKLKIPHKGFHSLRHTFATRAIECGMDVKTLSEILGHKNPTVTLNRYAHSLMEHKKEMMNRLGKLL